MQSHIVKGHCCPRNFSKGFATLDLYNFKGYCFLWVFPRIGRDNKLVVDLLWHMITYRAPVAELTSTVHWYVDCREVLAWGIEIIRWNWALNWVPPLSRRTFWFLSVPSLLVRQEVLTIPLLICSSPIPQSIRNRAKDYCKDFSKVSTQLKGTHMTQEIWYHHCMPCLLLIT